MKYLYEMNHHNTDRHYQLLHLLLEKSSLTIKKRRKKYVYFYWSSGTELILSGNGEAVSENWHGVGTEHAYVVFNNLTIKNNGTTWVIVNGSVTVGGYISAGGGDGAYASQIFVPTLTVE